MTTKPTRPKRRLYTGLLAVQSAAIVVSAALLLVGVLGFVPGITTKLDALQLAGNRSEARLFDVFEVSVLLNLIHVAVGIVGLALMRTYARARAYLLGGGLLFLGLWIWGLVVNPNGAANIFPVNNADNWLHLGLGVTMVVLALTLAGAKMPTGAGGEILIQRSE
ncbi:hypothetical protein BH09ACT7_BH09ACT7_17220 [soil metagenome]